MAQRRWPEAEPPLSLGRAWVIGQANIQKPGGKEGARKGPQVGMGVRHDLRAEHRAGFKKAMGQVRRC